MDSPNNKIQCELFTKWIWPFNIYIFSYRQNTARISRIFRDRPQHPLDTAIYWVEYVLKFNGARHLRSPAHGLTWYQYLLLDVAFFVAISIYLIALSMHYILKKLIQIVRIKPKIIVRKYYSGKKVDWDMHGETYLLWLFQIVFGIIFWKFIPLVQFFLNHGIGNQVTHFVLETSTSNSNYFPFAFER